MVDAIIIAAERVLDRDGIAGLTTNHIAEHAGVSIGTLYRYFPNREAIVAALYERYIATYSRVLFDALSHHASAPLHELLVQIGDAMSDLFDRQPPIHGRLFQLRTASGIHQRIAAHLDELTVTIARILEARGVATSSEAATIAFALVHAIDGVNHGFADRHDHVDKRAVIGVLARMIGAYLESLGWDRKRPE